MIIRSIIVDDEPLSLDILEGNQVFLGSQNLPVGLTYREELMNIFGNK